MTFNKSFLVSSLLACVFITTTGCGGSSSSSGQNTDNDTPDLVGVYNGMENISLINSTGETIDEKENQISINIDRNGVVQYASQGGNNGSTNIRENRQFILRADGRTQFNGLCSSGEIIIVGQLNGDNIDGTYSSENLVCNNEAYQITGSFSASR